MKNSAVDNRKDILNNNLDIVFQTRFEVDNEEDVIGIPFDRGDLSVVVSKFHPLAGEKEITMEQLRGNKYIGIKPTSDHLPFAQMINILEANGYNPESIMIAESVEDFVLAVSCNLAVGHLFSPTDILYGNLISYLKTKDNYNELEIDMAWNKNNKNKAMKKLIEYVRSENEKAGMS